MSMQILQMVLFAEGHSLGIAGIKHSNMFLYLLQPDTVFSERLSWDDEFQLNYLVRFASVFGFVK